MEKLKFDSTSEKVIKIITVIVYILSFAFLPFVLLLFYRTSFYDILAKNFNLIFYMIFAIILAYQYRKFIKYNLKNIHKDFFKNLLLTISTYIIMLGLVIICSLILKSFSDVTNANQDSINNELKNNFLPMFLAAVIFGPFVEELVFRGLIFRLLRNKFKILSHIITALLFGLYHVWTYVLFLGDFSQLINVLPYFAMGLAFSILYENTDNIAYPLLLHMANNFISCL